MAASDDNKSARPDRAYRKPGSKWAVVLTARESFTRGKTAQKLSPDQLLTQATAALHLLCRFGGVGAKSRKGYGSFADLPEFDLAVLKRQAADFRAAFGPAGRRFTDAAAGSPSLEQMLDPLEVPSGGRNVWLVLDQIGSAAQRFTKNQPKNLRKALGLPRNLRNPGPPPFRPGRHVHDPRGRHSSPVHYHVADFSGVLIARVTFLPAAELPSLADSRAVLTELRAELEVELHNRFRDFADRMMPKPATPARPAAPVKRASGSRATVRIVGPRANGFDVQEAGRPQGTLTINTPPAGTDTAVGASVDVEVHNDDPNKPQYRWTKAPSTKTKK